MPDIIKSYPTHAGIDIETMPVSPPTIIQTKSLDSKVSTSPSKIDFHQSGTRTLSLSEENQINSERLEELKRYFTPQLIHLIIESDFEYGIESPVDVFLKEKLAENSLATKSWLTQIFASNFSNPTILIGIIRAISRLPFLEISPEGEMIAMAALSYKDIEVRECGIRAFENWGNLQSLSILENLTISPASLQNYADRVVKSLREELHVTTDKKNKPK